jgi:hypothetical protein
LELAAQQATDMEIVNLLLENKTVYKELKVKGRDRVFNCALQNANAGLSNEFEFRLRSRGITRKRNIFPEADKLEDESSETNEEENCEEEEETRRETKPITAQTTVVTEKEK